MRLGTYYRSRLLRRLGLNRVSGRVLDIGGFDGYWASSLDSAEVVLIDVDPHPVFPAVRYVRADGLLLPFADAVFDAVYAIDVIEHVPDERRLIEEALRVLRRGGRLILKTPNETVQIFPKMLQPWVNRRWGHHRVPGFSAKYLAQIFEGEAVTDVTVLPLAMSAFRWSYLPLSLLWRLPGPLGRWLANLVAAWGSRHVEGEHGSILVQATRGGAAREAQPL